MEAHKLASYFPIMEGEQFEKFKQDIKENGQLEPIITFDGKILDGLNRYRACTELGIEPKFTEYKGSDPLHYVISVNVHRRHMTVSQLAMVATEMLPEFEKEAKKRQGVKIDFPDSGPEPIKRRENESSEQVAQEFGISGKSVRRAKRVKEQAPEKVADIISGKENIRSVDTELRLKAAQERATIKGEIATEKKVRETPKAVKDYFNAVRDYEKALDFAVEVAKRSLFAEESLNILQTKHDKLKSKMATLEDLV